MENLNVALCYQVTYRYWSKEYILFLINKMSSYIYIGEFTNKYLSKMHKIDLYKPVINTLNGDQSDIYYAENVEFNHHELIGYVRSFPKPTEGQVYRKAKLYAMSNEELKALY
jgi:hypothetical protein